MSTSILHLTTVHYWADNRIHSKYVKSLSELGYSVAYAFPSWGEEGRTPPKDSNITYIHMKGVDRRSSRLRRVISGFREALKVIRSGKYSIVHAHDAELIPLLFFVNKVFRQTVVFDMHEDLIAQLQQKEITSSKKWLAKYLLAATYRLFLKNIPTVFAEESYKKRFDYISTTVNALNYPKTLTKKSSNHFTPLPLVKNTWGFVYIGSITEDRGAKVMIDAINQLSKQENNFNYTLHYYGIVSDTLLSELESISKSKNFSFKFKGFIDPDDFSKLEGKYHFSFSLLKPLPNYLHSVPTKLYDYFGINTIPICSDFPFYMEKFEATSAFVPYGNIKQIAGQISDLIKNYSTLHTDYIHAQSKIIATLNWESQLNKVIQLYDKIGFSPLKAKK